MINFVNTGADEAILKSMSADGCSEDLIKAMNKQGLVQKDVTVQGKNGKTFTRKQWVKAGDSTGDSSKKQISIPDAVKECGVTGNETVQELEKIRRDLYKEMTYYFKKYDKALASNDSDANVWGTMAGGKQNRLGTLDKYIKGIKSAQASSASQGNKKKAPTQPTSQATTQTAQVAQNPQGKGAKLSKEDAKKKTQSYTSKVGKTDAERKAFMDKAKSQGISWKEDAHTGINWMRCCMAMNKHFAEGGSFDSSSGKDTDSNSAKITNKSIGSKNPYHNTPGFENIIPYHVDQLMSIDDFFDLSKSDAVYDGDKLDVSKLNQSIKELADSWGITQGKIYAESSKDEKSTFLVCESKDGKKSKVYKFHNKKTGQQGFINSDRNLDLFIHSKGNTMSDSSYRKLVNQACRDYIATLSPDKQKKANEYMPKRGIFIHWEDVQKILEV